MSGRGIAVFSGSGTTIVHEFVDDGTAIIGSGSALVQMSGNVEFATSGISCLADVSSSAASPSTDQVLKYDGSKWAPGDVSQTGDEIGIGTPTDTTYTDGFFDTFTSNTLISDAIDEISEAFLDLAPAKAGILTSTSLSKTSPSTFTAKIAGGLESDLWYVSASAHDTTSLVTANTTVTLATADTSTRFRAGKKSDLEGGTLAGSVTGSRAYGSDAIAAVSSRPYTDDTGTTGIINLNDLAEYNTFWAKANARISDTISQTGSVRYKVNATDGAGETNEYQLFYAGDNTVFPSPSFSSAPSLIESSSVTYNYLSGIHHYKTATFQIDFDSQDLFNPVYTTGNQASVTSTYTNTANVNRTSPLHTDTLSASLNGDLEVSLSANKSSAQSLGTATVSLNKPNKSAVTSNVTLGDKRINSYSSAQSGQNSNSQIEYFLDEAQRMTDLQASGSSFASGSALNDGELQVQNGRLIAGTHGDYSGHVSGSTTESATFSNYFRKCNPGTTNRQLGTVVLNKNGFSGGISQWGSTGKLQVAIILASDITDTESASTIYDLGREVGNDSGDFVGVQDNLSSNTYTWALPSGINTASDHVVLWVRFRNTTSSDYINQITVTFST